MANELIEISGTPPLEGKEGFYGSYLNLLAQIINAHMKPDTLENNKIVAINLIKIGIASIPDPKKIHRDPIYTAVQKLIDEEIALAKEENGGKISADEERDIVYNAYIIEGIGGLSTWMDNVAGLVTKNVVSRTGNRK